ncbi:MAG: nuclear transport factor 2 family protein [Candidatus Binatia bacterium]
MENPRRRTSRTSKPSASRGALGSPRVVSMHHGHHPEIEFTGADTARGTWYLEDKILFLDANTVLRGAAFYGDEYLRVDGQWRIHATGYERTFEEVEVREQPLQVRTRFDAAQ